MTPKEDQQPMTTRDELVALADEAEAMLSGFNGIVGSKRPVVKRMIAALRVAARQEVSVTAEELARWLPSGSHELARDLLAAYFITKREG